MAESEHILEVSEADFGRRVLSRSNEVPVVVDFWAPWCVPCRTLGPLLERLAEEGKGAFLLAKVNVDENPNLSATYEVRQIPTVHAFREGKVIASFMGNQPEAKVREFIKSVAGAQADHALAEATSFLVTRHWAEAEDAFRKIWEDRPGSGVAAVGLMKALIAQGRGCEALGVLEEFPPSTEVAIAQKMSALANLLCQVEGADEPVADTDLDALYYNSARLLARANWEAAMDGLLDVLRQNKRYRQGEPRKVMLGIFELLGEDDVLIRNYRAEFASVIF
jgi:putative thioredoxin